MPELQNTLWDWATSPLAQRGIAAVVGVLVLLSLMLLVRRSITRMVSANEARYRLRKFVSFVGYAAIALFLAASFSDRLGQFGVAFGVIGAGIAFALQELIASVAGWVAISFGSYYKPGDRIQMAGVRGDVIDIGMLRTTLMECGEWVNGDLYTGRIVRISNSHVLKDQVFNYSADFAFLWDEIELPVKYGSDYALARRLLSEVAEEVVGDYAAGADEAWKGVLRKYLVEPASVKPTVSMVATEANVTFTLRYVVDYRQRRATKDLLFQRILEEVDQNADRLGISAAALNIEKVAPVEVTLRKEEEPGEPATA